MALALTVACAKGDAPAGDAPTASPAAASAGAGAGAGAEGLAGAVAGASAKPVEPEPQLPPAQTILDRASEAIGTPEAIGRVESFYYRSTVEMVGQNIDCDMQIWWKKGDFFMEQIVPGFGEIHAGKLGDEYWSSDPINGRRRLSGAEAEQLTWASSLMLAADWNKFFDTANTVDERNDDGRTVYDVALSTSTGLTATLTFDAESGLQVGQSYEQVGPMGKQPYSIEFEDYREVEGVKIAFTQVIDAKVQRFVQRISLMKLNAEIDESTFGFPKTGDVVRQPKAG